MIHPRMLGVFLGLALLVGCRQPSPEVFFHTLTPLAPTGTRLQAAGKPLALEIMPVQLPELLQRSQFVVLDGQGRHRLAPTHRWGNTLEKDMQRVLTENLSALLGSDAVVPYPAGDKVAAAYRVALAVQQCDGAPGGTLQFRATWLVTHTRDGQMVLLRRWNRLEPVPGGTLDDLVSAHDRVMEALSRTIAETLKNHPEP